MGQLLNVLIVDAVLFQEPGFDCCPKTLLECVIDGKLHTRRFLMYKKRSYEEVCTQVADLLFSKSLLQVEDAEPQDAELLHQQDVEQRHVNKKRHKQKQVVTYTDTATETRHRMLPTMSIW
jgi:hypothetical protein